MLSFLLFKGCQFGAFCALMSSMISRLIVLFKFKLPSHLVLLFTLFVVSFPVSANDHSLYQNALRNYDALLKSAVDQSGVDYGFLKKNQHAIEQYLYALGKVNLDELQKNEKLAVLINAYNVYVLRLILDYWPDIKSIKDIPEYPVPRRFKDKRWKLSGRLVSLNDIENNYIAPMQVPVAYMALVCATRSCPDLRPGVYDAVNINEQLIDATKNYLSQRKALRWGMKKSLIGIYKPALYVSELFRWEKNAIELSGYTITSFVEEFGPVDAREYIVKYRKNLSLIYLDYDWRLNKRVR